MTETATTTILLVRAIEDTQPEAVPAPIAQKAVDYAGDPTKEEEWFARRALFLLDQLPTAYRSILQLSTIPPRWGMAIGGGACLLGLASNYLSPSGKIHALWNPMVLLVT
ncbi:MAG TPA: hypothetical protein VNN62_26935 [Methylomirabilota bacterium]|jgi:hypothetical protein|nr:hypothetical protein [Methylomirabilota bacterium]